MNKFYLKRGKEIIDSQVFRIFSPIDFGIFLRFVDEPNFLFYSVKSRLLENPHIAILNRNTKNNSGILILKKYK
jgi:hypothetical protein